MFSPSRGRWCGRISFLSAAMLGGTGGWAAEPISEAAAIERALAVPEFSALGEAERDEAEARVSGIRRFDNPEASVNRESVSGAGRSETEWQVGVVQPIDLSGRRSSLRAAARAEASAIDADIARRRQERIAAVRRAYAGCAAAQEKNEIAQRYTVQVREAARIVTARTQAGDTAGYDLRRLRVEARDAEAQARLTQGEVVAECATLAQLTSTPEARTTASLRAILTSASSTEAARRLDLVARERRVEAAAQQVRAAERARLPEIGVGVGYKWVTSDGGTASGPALSIGAAIPLFNNGNAAIAEARARQRAREAELALARRDVAASVAAARARAEAATQAAEAAETAREDAARLGPIAEAAYQGGEGGVVELVDAYRSARDAEISIIDLTERAVGATIDLELAEGGL